MNDTVTHNVPEDVQEQTVVTFVDQETGNEVTIPVEGPVTVVQDREFSDDTAGN